MTGVRPIYVALHNKSSIICASQHLAAKYRFFLTFWIIPARPHCPPTALVATPDRRATESIAPIVRETHALNQSKRRKPFVAQRWHPKSAVGPAH
jgi:hypothetical protein